MFLAFFLGIEWTTSRMSPDNSTSGYGPEHRTGCIVGFKVP